MTINGAKTKQGQAKMFLYTLILIDTILSQRFLPFKKQKRCICNWNENLQLKDCLNIYVNSRVFIDHIPVYIPTQEDCCFDPVYAVLLSTLQGEQWKFPEFSWKYPRGHCWQKPVVRL